MPSTRFARTIGLFLTRSQLKKEILVQGQGGPEIQPADILKYFEELKRGHNADIGFKDSFEIASIIKETITMPKIKTNRAAAKRFSQTGSGKYRFRKSHASHILTKKETKQKRNLTRTGLVDKADEKNVKQLLAMK